MTQEVLKKKLEEAKENKKITDYSIGNVQELRKSGKESFFMFGGNRHYVEDFSVVTAKKEMIVKNEDGNEIRKSIEYTSNFVAYAPGENPSEVIPYFIWG